MVVQHNLTAMNSNRMLGITTKAQAKATEKLSSGYKINRAADDAAGLAISEKMRKQIRGLTQASLNAQDGISAVQTAEGALTEVHDMIQRMNELAVKSANGTNSQEERNYIQNEVNQLISEIDRVAETTKFNDLYLLKGGSETATVDTAASAGVDFKAVYAKSGSEVAVHASVSSGSANGGYDVYKAGSSTKLTEAEVLDLLEIGQDSAGNDIVKFKDGVTDLYYKAAANSATDDDEQVSGGLHASDLGTVKDAGKLYSNKTTHDSTTAIAESNLSTYIDTDGHVKGNMYDEEGNAIGAESLADYVTVTAKKDAVAAGTKDVSALKLNLHVGAESATTNKISVTIKKMDSATIGVGSLDVSSEDAATAAIDKLNGALKIVSEQRADLGAVQNRLEHTINNLDNVVENTTSAESQIRDTDMATQMVTYSNNNILAQAGQAMLAQSNQANQGVLSLLG